MNKHLEWCPPGHGDLYTALYGSGALDELLAEGVKYMFVSNSDNLGATLDVGEFRMRIISCFFSTYLVIFSVNKEVFNQLHYYLLRQLK